MMVGISKPGAFAVFFLLLLVAFAPLKSLTLSGYIVDSGLDVATEKLLNAYQKMIHDASSAQSMSDFTRQLTWSIMQLLHHVPPSVVSSTVEKETRIASINEALPNADEEICVRDYTIMCPNSYFDVGDGIHCKALQSYSGNCDSVLDMSNKTPNEKKQIALACGVEWKCRDACVQDLKYSCPQGWIDLGDALCQAPDAYTGKCVRQKSFKNFDESMKEQWALECEVHWPCKKNIFDFSARLCPFGWTETEDKKCIAPNYYIGLCDSSLAIVEMSDKEKAEVASLCKLQWPTEAEVVSNFSASCPVGWILINSNDCKAPKSYDGPCNHIQSFENFSDEDKYKWAQNCAVMWPFKDDDVERNYDGPASECPMGWKLLSKDMLMCQAPAAYKGPCSSPFSFKNYSPEMKSAWAHACKAQYAPKNLLAPKKQIIKIPKAKLLPDQNNGVLGPPNSPFFNKILAANGTVYFPSGRQNVSNLPPVKASVTASEILATQRHIKQLEAIQKYEKNAQIKSAIEDAIENLKTSGGNEKIDFSFMQAQPKHQNAEELDTVETAQLDCVRNYNTCPKGWQNIDGIRCVAPDVYIENGGSCNSVVEIGRMVNKYGEKDIEQIKHWAKKCNVEFPCVTLQKDYVRSLCPEGWQHVEDGNCIAPENYPETLKERCGSVVNFLYATPEFRQSWARVCRADWPLFANCEIDYSSPCPIGFKKVFSPTSLETKTNECKAIRWRSEAEEEICSSPLFVADDPKTKQEISSKCGVSWGCVGQCDMDFWQKCPYGWIYKSSYCYAPPSYVPPPGCSTRFNAKDDLIYSNEGALTAFATLCHAPWPCKGSCQPDWREPCPEFWDYKKTIKNSFVCVPPRNYRGPCNQNQDLASYTFAQKQEFAFRCMVTWKCGGTKTLFGVSLKINKKWQNTEAYTDTNWELLTQN